MKVSRGDDDGPDVAKSLCISRVIAATIDPKTWLVQSGSKPRPKIYI
jgi:hypothetical protein